MSTMRRDLAITEITASGRTRYRAVADFGLKPDGSRKQVRRTFDTRKEAKDWIAESRTLRRAGLAVPPSKVTVGELLDTWMTGARHLKPSTRSGYEVHLTAVRERLGGVTAQQLTKRQVEDLVEHMLATGGRKGKGRSASTVRQTLVVFEQAMRDAERQGIVARNVVRLVAKPRQTRHEMKVWTAAQLTTFLDQAAEDRYAALWRVAAFALRRGEVCGLRWIDVDWDEGAIRVASTRIPIDSKTIAVGEPKTAAGRRTVPLDDATIAALRSFRAVQAAERLAAGELYTDTGLIAVDETGQPISPDAYGDRFARIAKAAGLPAIRLHDLRHTAATLMHESGEVPLRTLAAMLGHADASFTLRTYAHSSDESKAAASKTLANLFETRSAGSL
jgi:integrase